MTGAIVAGAWLTDAIVGDPEWAPHPVRWMGRGISAGERLMNRHANRAAAFSSGTVLALSIVGATAGAAWMILIGARTISPSIGALVEVLMAATTLATRSLLTEAGAVLSAMGSGDLEAARVRLARIVGRDTRALCPQEIYRAVIETVAESTSDGIVAPLFYLALGGVPAAMAYKAVNTLDSMIGHPEAPYTWFGKCSARLDDAANYLPSRLTAGLIALAAPAGGGHPWRAVKTWRLDGGKHPSPNAGQVEAAMAGALGVRLGGSSRYDGADVARPFLGAAFVPPTFEAARRSLVIAAACSILACALAAGLARSVRG